MLKQPMPLGMVTLPPKLVGDNDRHLESVLLSKVVLRSSGTQAVLGEKNNHTEHDYYTA